MQTLNLMTAVIALGMLFSCALAPAADPSALAQLRAKLPNPGTVVIGHEDGSTLRPAVTEGSTSEVVDVAPAANVPIRNARRINVAKAYPAPYNVQLFSQDTQTPIAKGDTVLLSCWVRSPDALAGASGLATIYLQATGPQWSSLANASVTLGTEWKQVFAAGTAERDYAPGSLQIAVHLGQQKQQIEMGGVYLLDLGPNVDITALPRQEVVWDGMEPDAPWRAEAQRRIEQYRMARLNVQVLDAAGAPLPNATVRVEQQKRAFGIGSFTAYRLLEDTPDGEHMREIFLRLFNRATSPVYWADWGWPNQKPLYLALGQWLHDHQFITRGHVMVYPTFRLMPADVVKLKDQPEKLRQRIEQQVTEISQATRPLGYREYDVTNELRDCKDLHGMFGREVVVDWFAAARKELPGTLLALNENTILTNGGATQSQQDNYLGWYRLLKSKGQAPDVMGLQGHFGEDVTAPTTVWAILDRFAAETDAELQITEFDMNTLDEQAQAAYTHDFLTACFAHPRITGFTMWGIWEGDHWMPRAALYRKDWSPKPNAIMLEELLTKTWWTNATLTTDASGNATVKAFLGGQRITVEINGKTIEQTVTLNDAGRAASVVLRP